MASNNIFIYTEKVKELLSMTNIVKADDVFCYEDTPLEDECEYAFQFYQANFNNHTLYNIPKCIMYFDNKRTQNAYACYDYNANIGIIGINVGLIQSIKSIFENLNKIIINDENLNEYDAFRKTLDIPIEYLMFQTALHYTFYHELGHIIQKSEFLKTKLYENNINEKEFCLRKHILEIDADDFSALYIGRHCLQYFDKMFKSKFDKDNLEKLVIVMNSAIFIYFLSFKSNKENIYFKKFTHPHPIIRVVSILSIITNYINGYLNDENKGFQLDNKLLVNKIFTFIEITSKEIFPNYENTDFINTLFDNNEKIMNYISEIRNITNADQNLAVYKLNHA